MCSLTFIIFRIFYYSLFAWIILSWIQVPYDHPIGQIKSYLDKYFEKVLAPIRNRVPVLRVGMAGIDLSPLILIIGFNFLQPYILRIVCWFINKNINFSIMNFIFPVTLFDYKVKWQSFTHNIRFMFINWLNYKIILRVNL